MFGAHFSENALVELDREVLEGEAALTFGTRYFTPAHVCRNETSIQLGPTIDPLGLLAKAIGTRGKHLDDNRILYHEYKHDRVGSKYVFSLQLQELSHDIMYSGGRAWNQAGCERGTPSSWKSRLESFPHQRR